MASAFKNDYEIDIQSRNIRKKMNFLSSSINLSKKTIKSPSKSSLLYLSKCENCKNWERLNIYEKKLKLLSDEKERLTKVNNYLMITITRKDEILLKLMKENKNFLGEINSYKIQVKNMNSHNHNHFTKNISSDSDLDNSDSSIKDRKLSTNRLNPTDHDSNKRNTINSTRLVNPDSMKRGSTQEMKRSDSFKFKDSMKIKIYSKKNVSKFSSEPKKEEKKEVKKEVFSVFNVINDTIQNNLDKIEEKTEKIKKKLCILKETNLDGNLSENKTKYLKSIKRLSQLSNQLVDVDKLLLIHENSDAIVKNPVKDTFKKRNSVLPSTFNTQNFIPSTKLFENHGNDKKGGNYYDKLLIMAKKNINRKKEGNVRTSYLSMNEDFLRKLPKTELMKEVYNLTLNDEDFLHAMRILPEDKIATYCDLIGNTIKDFEKAINVIYRVKNFLRVSNKVYKSMTSEESVKIIIKNACEILDCDRSTIFTYDKYTKCLILQVGEGMRKSDVKIPSDRGIVGIVFTKGERIKIDDAYLDDRFNKDVDMKTNYRTRTILCVPLKDHENNIIGVIQSINKRNGLFTFDDEEIMEIFAKQASSILQNSIISDEFYIFSSRLRSTIDFAVKLWKCPDYSEFSSMNEDILSYYFSSNNSQVLFYSKIKKCLFKLTKYEKSEKKCNFGIVGYVFNSKEMIGFNSVDESTYFNNIIDLETGYPLITFPILNKKDEVLAIVQTAYPSKLNLSTNLPKDNEISLLKYYIDLCAVWIESKHSIDSEFFKI